MKRGTPDPRRSSSSGDSDLAQVGCRVPRVFLSAVCQWYRPLCCGRGRASGAGEGSAFTGEAADRHSGRGEGSADLCDVEQAPSIFSVILFLCHPKQSRGTPILASPLGSFAQ